MIIDHVAIAVRSIERSIEHWQTVFGYQQVTELVTNTRQKVRVVFLASADRFKSCSSSLQTRPRQSTRSPCAVAACTTCAFDASR
jgi:catechol 2,3-dioxygenase-like lactoylglutathione lyase family enzyme